MAFLNPFTGELIATDPLTIKNKKDIKDLQDNQYKPQEVYTLTSEDITNKYITLAVAPTHPELSRLSVIGGCEQAYGTDFVVSGSVLSWDSLPLQSLLQAGDKLIINLK